MKILIYGIKYAPELSGTGRYTAEMAEALAAAGHTVEVVCAPPYYPAWRVADGYAGARYARETRSGVRVSRAPLWVPARPSGKTRLVHLASFALSSLPLLARYAFWRPDVVFAVAPALICAPAAWALARVTGARAWLHLQDYEVDAAFELGILKRGAAAHLAYALERMLLARFDVVSTISGRMLVRALGKGVDSARLFHLPNWVDTRTIFPLAHASDYRRQLGIPAGASVVLYSGNMGAKQGLDVLADAAQALAARADIHFVFCGDGPARAALAARCEALPTCRFLPLQPAERLNELLNAADIHVLPQRADAADLVMPSKLTGMLASGRAIVAMASPGTELFETVAGRGVTVPPGDAAALAHALASLADAPALRASLGRAAREYAVGHLAPDVVFAMLDARLRKLCGAAERAAAPAPQPFPAQPEPPGPRQECYQGER